MRNLNLKKGDVYAIKGEKYHCWCLYQITYITESYITLCILDWFSPNLPSKKNLISLSAQKFNYYNFNNEYYIFNISPKKPKKDYKYVGNIDVKNSSKGKNFGEEWLQEWHDTKNILPSEEQHYWDSLPEKVTKNYKSSSFSREKIYIEGNAISKGATSFNVNENFKLKELDELGALHSIFICGNYDYNKTINYLNTRPLISSLYLKDVSTTRVNLVALKHIKTVVLINSKIKRLSLSKKIKRFCVDSNYSYNFCVEYIDD